MARSAVITRGKTRNAAKVLYQIASERRFQGGDHRFILTKGVAAK